MSFSSLNFIHHKIFIKLSTHNNLKLVISNIIFTKSYLHQLVFNENHNFIIVNTKLKNDLKLNIIIFKIKTKKKIINTKYKPNSN